MKILQGILSESKEYYSAAEKKIEKELSILPKGSVKRRVIYGQKYFYLQYRNGNSIVQKYLGKANPGGIIKQISRRRVLKQELKKIKEALKIIKRSEGRKHG
jgi:hypothetical protein